MRVFLFPKFLKAYVEQDAKFIWPGGMLVQIFSGREPAARYDVPIRNQVKAFVSLPDETRGIAQNLFIEELLDRDSRKRIAVDPCH
jgi:hypothetical protein